MVPLTAIIISVFLPVYALYRKGKNRPVKRPYIYSCISFTACIIAMLQQLMTIKNRLFSVDIGGIEDTIQGVIVLSIGVLIVTLLVNLAFLAISYEEE